MASSALDYASVLLAFAVVPAIFTIGRSVYNLFFHPLRQFPGPLLHRASRLPYIRESISGNLAKNILHYHDRYGPVVRIAPDELSFIDPDAWRDIYGHRTGSLLGADEMPKFSGFYRTRGVPPSLIAETRENHSLLRKQFSHGFSDQSMREQEPIIGGYVDLLIKRLREHCSEVVYTDDGNPKTRPKALDMKTWYNWTTFDIIGDLAFGEPFGCLDKAEYNPWVAMISNSIKTGAYFQALKYLYLDRFLRPIFRLFLRSQANMRNQTANMLKRRMAAESRSDLIDGLLKKQSDWNLDFGRIRANAGLLVIAGSETTATLLSGATYFLLTNPDVMATLKKEVRLSFKSEDEITLTSVGNLTYMLNCLKESLRMYPPVPFGLPRQVPKGGAKIAGHLVPEDTVVGCWQYAMYYSKSNFEDPFTFQPERYAEGGKNKHDKLDALQPFSVGPRNCIGRNLAYAEMRLILARILFNFDLELADPNLKWMDQKVFTLWSKPELNVYLTPVR